MIYSAFLPRRLSQPGCLIAGTQLATYRDKLKDEKIKLSTKVDAAVHAVLEQTRTIELLASTDEQSARLADATAVRAALFPAGTGFVKAIYGTQWLRMSAVIKALDGKETTAAVKRLGLTAEADRLRQWTSLYGAKLGLTEARETDPAAVAVEAWHEAYGELTVHVHSEYGSAKDEAQTRVRETLVSPYQAQAEEERRAEQKARGKRKAEEPVAAAPADAAAKIKK
jgi:hypothetical protein